MSERPQREYRVLAKEGKIHQIVKTFSEIMEKGIEGQGEISVLVKYNQGGICSATVEAKNTHTI
jgi:hypothetical protein